MQKSISFQILIIFSLIIGNYPMLQAEELVKTDYTNYVNQDGCYSVKLPSSWKIETLGEEDDISAVSPAESPTDKMFENVEIWVDPLDTPMTIDEYYSQSLENLKKHSTTFELKDEGSRTLDGKTIRWFRAIVKRGGITGEILQYQAIVDGHIYIINFTAEPSAYKRFEQVFETIVSSFRFTCE